MNNNVNKNDNGMMMIMITTILNELEYNPAQFVNVTGRSLSENPICYITLFTNIVT